MSRVFSRESLLQRVWQNECALVIALHPEIAEGDVIDIWSTRGKRVVAIIFNGEPERIDDNVRFNYSIRLRRKHTDRYENAFEYFAAVIELIRECEMNIYIEVHPSDKGLATYVESIDTRMHSYTWARLDSDYEIIQFKALECNYEDADEKIGPTPCFNVIDIFWYEYDSDDNVDGSDDITVTEKRLSPKQVSEEVDKEFERARKPQEEMLRVYPASAEFESDIWPWHVEKVKAANHKIVDRDGTTIPVRRGEYILTKVDYATEKSENEKQCNREFGKNYRLQLFAGINRYFDTTTTRNVHQVAQMCCAGISQETALERILDSMIALAALDLPPYVLLWINDFLPGMLFTKHIVKIRYIEAVRKSIHGVQEKRAQRNKESRTAE